MRRWLQLGAASAGVSAALLGFSTLAPEIGVAAAETESTSASAQSSASSDSEPSSSAAAQTDAGDEPEPDTDEPEPDDSEPEPDDSEPELEDDESDDESDDDEPEDLETSETSDTDDLLDAEDDVAEPVKRWATRTEGRDTERRQDVAGQIEAFTESSKQAIESLPVGEPVKDLLNGGLYFVRRTFLNQAPVVAPVTLTAGSSGPVTGRIDAVDPDGDRLVYRLVRGPESGIVQINPDGTYTYTPGTDFDGVATFTVAAHDVGLHVNLADLFRPLGTRADVLVNQGAVNFAFNYTTGAEHWTPERQAALRDAADALMGYFLVTKPVTLTYDVEAYEDWDSPTLATGFSQLIDTETAGFFPGIVQHKLQTGADANGDQADGWISWNFGRDWALTGTATPTQLDFRTTALHELTHSLGFAGSVDAAGENSNPNRADFDRWITTADGTVVIGADGQWNSAFDPNLTGGNGGLYFGGPNAVAAYGAPVPLYTPNPWASGSSGSHLDDHTFTGIDRLLMNAGTVAGPGLHALSPIELGILADLGYVVVPPNTPTARWAAQAAVIGSDRPWATQQSPSPSRDPVENLVRGVVATLPAAVRQSLFNQAPTVGGTVITGGAAGESIVGHVQATDPEGDAVVYRLSKRPTAGTVVLGADGSWTYVPDAGFGGVDTFVIVADDTGPHVNLLDLLWSSGTRSSVLVNQGAVSFEFTYTTGAEHWTTERRAELNSAARYFADNIIVEKAVTLDYEVTGWDSASTSILATASSGLAVTGDAFLQTWVQNKLRTGTDPNGAAADGFITWNFAYPWALGTSVGPNELDFSTVAMHELMHSFGFISMVQAPGANTGTYWTVYDSFLVDSSGARAIGRDLTWRRELDPNLTGGNGGLFYAGPNAVAVHGGLVPLFAEDPWTASNVAHVDDDTIDDLMNPGIDRGPGDRTLSPLMLAIMQDLGYVVVQRMPGSSS